MTKMQFNTFIRSILLLAILSGCSCTTPVKKIEEASVSAAVENQIDYSSFYNLKGIKPLDKKAIEKFSSDLVKREKCINKEYCTILPVRQPVLKTVLIPFKVSEFDKLETNDFDSDTKILRGKNVKEVVKFYSASTPSNVCPKNFSAAIVKKIDPDISDTESYKILDQVYSQVIRCPTSTDHEFIHLKMAILYNYFNQPQKAKIAITNALSDNMVDYARINYWAGVILKDESYWHKVLELRPYSFHATEIATKLNINLYEKMKSKAVVYPKRSDTLLTKYVESLLYYKRDDLAYKLVNYNLEKITIQEALYYTKLFDKQANCSETIKLITRIAQFFPKEFNSQFIDISYKVNFFANFEKYSNLVDPSLMISLSKQESGFNPNAKSRSNAYGLMQLLKSTAREVSKERSKNLYDPDSNIYLGVNYYKKLQDRFGRPECA
jgi:hypothetical protein